jgi:hypothetical protein
MNIIPRGKGVIFITASSLLLAGCVVRERVAYQQPAPVVVDTAPVVGEVDVSGPPPAPIEETVTVAPEPGFVWIGGVYVWGGGGWRWERGHWARPPHPGAVWIPHRYVYRGGRHVWVRGGWR